MDNALIGILIGGGSMLTSMAALAFNARYRSRADRRRESEDCGDEIMQRAELMCHNNQARILSDIHESNRRLYERIESVEHGSALQMLELSKDLSEIKGSIKAVQNSVNGGLEDRISRAVRNAIGNKP